MIEKYSFYEFKIVPEQEMFGYEIYCPDYPSTKTNILRVSDESFDTEQEARFAAIGHITLLEEGEG